MNAKLVDYKTLSNITESERREMLVAYIQEQLAKAIGIEPSQIKIEQPFNYMGIDSLTAIKLRNKLRADLKVDISTVEFMADSNTVSLVKIITERIVDIEANTSFSVQRYVSNSQSYPLSYGQQGLWFLYQLAPESAAYNIAFTARIRSSLNIPALQRACQKLIVRHPTLRTTFEQKGDRVWQTVHENQQVDIDLIDASSWNWDKLNEEVVDSYKRPFDLEKGPVVRVSLFTRSEQDYIFLLNLHHIVVDGFSAGILLNDLRLLYQSENTGRTLSLPEINWQYQDFVRWQKDTVVSPVGENLWSYWKNQLAGNLSPLELSSKKSQISIPKYQGSTYTFELTPELTLKLKKMALAEGVTLYMTLLAVFQVLLYRYTGQEDIVIGSPIEGRSKSEFIKTVGFFVNVIALRSNIASNLSFSELLTQVRQTVLDAIAHQDYPSTLLVEKLQLEQNLSLTRLLRVSFNLMKLQEIGEDIELSVYSNAKAKENWGGLRLEPFVLSQQEGQNDLIFDMMETKESLVGLFRYNTELFDAETISRMAGHFQTLVESVVIDSSQRISSLPLMKKSEQQNLLKKSSNTPIQYSQSLCIHQLFEAQVKKTPNAIAVEFHNKKLTYQELNQYANQLARYLRRLGVKPEVLVGIHIERSLEMMIGLWGILKAGGAYVPLDPAYPQERLSLMLSDSQVSVLLTQERLEKNFSASDSDIEIVCLDRDWNKISQESNANPENHNHSTNLAYVIYTSGSTGKPKGVMIEHQSLVNFTQIAKIEYKITKSDRILQFASISFDTATEEIYPCLTSGATLILRSEEMVASVPQFLQRCQEMKLTVLDLPTAYWHQWMAELETVNLNTPESLRLVIIGGEQVHSDKVAVWQKLLGDLAPQGGRANRLTLVNTYGPTEATIVATSYKLETSASVNLNRPIPIGKAIGNVGVYIVDRHLNIVPIGVKGELCIGGANVARGYLNRPSLTQEKFIPNPFNKEAGDYLYKTGDLARYLDDGNIEFLGRIDSQVKIRGFRVEIGEIEALLDKHPQIQEAIVIACDTPSDSKRLIAYIIPRQEKPTANELRRFLREKLPEYMVPSVFTTIDTLPLSPNGKVDRNALLAIDISHSTQSDSLVLPRNTVELQLAQIWAEILGVQHIGVQDNFFDLGGHSLLVGRLISKIERQFGKKLSLADLFRGATVEQLALLINQQAEAQPWSPLVPIQPQGNRIPFFCIHPVEGNVICYGYLSRSLGLEQPFYALQSPGLNNNQQPLDCLEDLAAYYIETIQKIQPQGPYKIGGWSLGGVIAFEMAQQLNSSGHQVVSLTLIDSYTPKAINIEAPVDKNTSVNYFFQALFLNAGLPKPVTKLEQNKLDDRLNYILEQGKKASILPSELKLEQIRRMFRVYRSNYLAMYRYQPQPYPGKITFLCASEKIDQASQYPNQDWEKLAGEGLEIYLIPGNHSTIIREPHVSVLAKQMTTIFERTDKLV